MANILTDILRPSVVTKIVSRIRTPRQVLCNWFGISLEGGPNVEYQTIPGLRQYTYDIYDNTREVARGRFPNASAGSIAANPVGNNTVTFGRFAEKLSLDYNKIAALRQIGENAGTIDRTGKTYVDKQAMTLNQRQLNLREVLLGSLFRGGIYYFFQNGDDLVPSYTSTNALFGVDLLIPSTHKLIGGAFGAGLALDGSNNTITATWATASNDIPLQLQKVSAGFEASVGEPLADVFCNYTVWNNILQNTYIRQLAGTSASPFAGWSKEDGKNPDGTDTGAQVGKIKGLEWINFHISDHMLNVTTTGSDSVATKLIPDDYCLFTIRRGDWLKGVEGTEIVKINSAAPATPQTGFFSWIKEIDDPARFELHGLSNFALELNIPKACAIARVQ